MATFEFKNYDHNALYTESYNTTGEQASIPIVYLPHGFTVQLTPTGGTASVQASNDGINWETWTSGAVSATKISFMFPVRYVRVNNIDATSCVVSLWGF